MRSQDCAPPEIFLVLFSLLQLLPHLVASEGVLQPTLALIPGLDCSKIKDQYTVSKLGDWGAVLQDAQKG